MGTQHCQTAYNANKDANGLYQGGLGPGVSAMPSWADYNGNHPVIPTSAGVSLADGVGVSNFAVLNSAGATVYTAPVPVFFGLKNPYGSLYVGKNLIVAKKLSDGSYAFYVARTSRGVWDYTATNDMLYVGDLAAPAEAGWDYIKRLNYNGLAGMPAEGGGPASTSSNPLEINDTFRSRGHIFSQRQKWFDCSCCPTTYCRFLPRLGVFCADAAPDKLRIDIPAAMEISRPEYQVEVTGKYPYDGRIGVKIRRGGDFALSIRIPSWSRMHEVLLNGKAVEASADGYWTSKRVWQSGDEITLLLKIVPELVYANPCVPSDIGKAAVRRGPVVYCLESVDNPGILLHSVRVPAHPEFTLKQADGLPEGTPALLFQGEAVKPADGPLYSTEAPEYQPVRLCAVPFALWQNRGESAMQIFLQVKA